MAKITLDLNRFKASGVYTIEFDASERIVVSTQTIRLIVGFSRKGPFNGPVFLRDVSTSRKVFGSIDSFLEKRGSYFHRALETCLQTAPVFGLNLLPLNDTPVNEGGDAVDYRSFAISASEENGNKTKALLSSFYNKERFWFPDESYLQATVDSKPANRGRLLNFVNLGQEVQSVIIRKSDNASLYNVTANDYYGRGNVPAYIQPNDYISDYFIDVYVVKGDWTNLQLLTQDPLYSKYFDLRGVKADKFFEFLSLDGITMTGSFSGTIIPDFIDNNGSNQSINVILNSAVALTGIFCDLNKDMFDDYDNSTYKVDMVGNSLINGTDDIIDFLSYNTPIKSILTFTGSLPTTAGGFDPVVQNTDTAVSPIIYVKSHSFGGARGKFNNVLVIPKPYPSDTTFTVSMYDALTAALTNSSLIKTLGTDTINDSRQPNDFVKIANVIDTGSSLEIQLSSPAHEDTAYENTSSDYAESNYILKSNATVIPSVANSITINNPLFGDAITGIGADTQTTPYGQAIATVTPSASSQVTPIGQQLVTATVDAGSSGALVGQPISTITTPVGTDFGQVLATITAQTGTNPGRPLFSIGTAAGTNFGQAIDTIGSQSGVDFGQAIDTINTIAGTNFGQALQTATVASGGAGAIAAVATYTLLPVLSSVNGTGAIASVTTDVTGAITAIAITTPGTGYKTSDTITIAAGWDGASAGAITLTVVLVAISYPALASTSAGLGTGATFTVAFDTAGVRTVTRIAGGTGYLPSEAITISGTLVGGSSTNNITFNALALVAISYPALASTSAGLGTGATFTVAYDNAGARTVTRIAGGTGYLPGAAITISGSLVGGSSANNITFNVANLAAITYPAVASTGGGNNATFDVAFDAAGVRTITPIAAGTGFLTGTAITIAGALVGGATPANNITFNATAVVPFAFTPVASSATGGNTSATFTVSYDANGAQTVTIVAPGTSFLLTDTITILGGLIGGVNTTNDITFNPATLIAITYPAVASTSVGLGTGATFDVAYDNLGARTVTRIAQGTGYLPNAAITIAGALVGGATPANNITFTVSTLLPQVYTNVPCTSSLSGTGSAYNVTYDSLGLLTVAIATAGTNYIVTELITINSVNVGGAPASNITFTVSSLVPITFTGIASSLTSGVGSGVLLNIGLNSAGNYVLPAQPINYGGINYAIGNTITIPGASLGVINSTAGNNCVVTVSALSLASSWVFQSTSINPEISDHTGRLLINKNRSTCDILDEIHPGFSRINLYAFSGTLGRNITSIKNITATLGPVGVFTNVVSTSSVDGVNATFNVTRTLSSTTITINNSGTRYEIGETITLLGSNVGGGSNITFVVNDITMPSKDDMIYSQIFRTRHAYLDSSNVGTTYSVWNNNPYVVDVIGLNGGKLYDLNNALISYQTQHGKDFSCYLEYEYDDFTTRERYYAGSSPNETLYLDYNVFPASDEFNTSTNFGTIYDDDHTNWFYDHGIVGNDYSLLILNTGVWKNGVGTILTLDDSNSELYKTDTFFLACQQSFDEDYAETHIGTRVQNWANYTEITWSTFCGNTWDTLDYSDSLWCSYVIDIVNTNGGIKFNEYPTFNFSGIIGGMSDPEKFSQALWELNNSDNPGISKFDYSIYAGILGGAVFNYAIPGWIDPAYYINSIQKIGSAKLNTYIAQNVVFYNNTASIVALDVLYGNTFVEPATVVTSVVTGSTIDPGYAGFVAAYVSKNIPKKARFTADSTASSNRLKNVIGLQAGSLRVGEVITGINLPSYPAVPAKVVQIVVVNGVIRDIVLDTYIQVTENYGYFEVEWITPDNTFITIPWLDATLTQADIQIFATAKNPSVDNLGYLVGTNGVTFLPPQYPSSLINTTTSHTFPMSNFYSWFGFGENKVGSFQYGLQEFLTKYRYAQSYLDLGTSPFGEPGWYPASNLPLPYTYTNNPTFDNYLNARAQSERLPYERSIGGAYTWEETRIGKYTTKIPVGSSVLLSAESSDIAGKTKYFWRIKEGNTILAETTDNRISWTYDYTGNFDVELTITDTNGNKSTKTKKSFLNIYEAAE